LAKIPTLRQEKSKKCGKEGGETPPVGQSFTEEAKETKVLIWIDTHSE
jgi:hypothetical protein